MTKFSAKKNQNIAPSSDADVSAIRVNAHTAKKPACAYLNLESFLQTKKAPAKTARFHAIAEMSIAIVTSPKATRFWHSLHRTTDKAARLFEPAE
jgi:hypothetical protein